MHREPVEGDVVGTSENGTFNRYVIEDVSYLCGDVTCRGRRLSPKGDYQRRGSVKKFTLHDLSALEFIGNMKRTYIWDD